MVLSAGTMAPGPGQREGHIESLKLFATLRSQRNLLSLFYWITSDAEQVVARDEIQGSYFVSFRKNDPFGSEGPLVWTETLGRDKREETSAESQDVINTNSSLSQYAPLCFQELFYLLRKMSHCDVLSEYFNYGLTWDDVTCCG